MKEYKIDANMINGIKGLEETLTRRDQEKSGDLSDLPAGHPALKAIQEAKSRHEKKEWLLTQAREEAREEEFEQQELKHKNAKKSKNKAQKQKLIIEEEQKRKIQTLVKNINKEISNASIILYQLSKEITNEKTRQILQTSPYACVKVKKLERLLLACHRGLVDSAINHNNI